MIDNPHQKSVFYDETELLQALLGLHVGTDTFDCDPFYFTGVFYKNIPVPAFVSDIAPKYNFVRELDVKDLPEHVSGINSIILDPPFMFGGHGKQLQYYSSATHGIFTDFDALRICYQNAIQSAYAVLNKRGVMVFKCQDYTDSKTTFTHTFVQQWAEDIGFRAKDLCLLIKPNKIFNSKTQQRHFRKIHTYFWVFIKK